MKIKILYKFIIVLILVSVIPLSFVGYKTVDINQKALRYATRTNHINTAKYLADRVDNFIGALREKLLFLINSQAVDTLNFNAKQVLIRSLVTSSEYFVTVSMLDSSGDEYIKTYHPDYEGEVAFVNQAGTELFNRAKNGPAVSSVYYSNGTPRLDIIYPLEKSYIFITITLNNIWEDIKNTDIGNYAAVFLVNEKGKVLAHPDKDKVGKKLDIPPVQAVLNRSSVGTMDFSYDGVKTVSAFAPVKSMGWGIVTEQPFKYAYASTITVKNNAYRWIVITIVLAVLVAYLFARRLSGPILKVIKGAKKIGDGNLDTKVEVKSRDELGRLADRFNEMAKGLKDRDFIKDTFGKYVSKQVAEDILNGRLKLGGERKTATVLMSDIRDFTAMSEKLSPEEVVEFLNLFFKEMVGVVTKYEGTLDKYIGDAILAVFGAPILHEDDPKRAVFAAIEMIEKLRQFNIKRIEEGASAINIGIAVHTGELVAGNIGSEVRMEYTVIGDTVNLTSRIEKLNRKFSTKILISESTYNKVKDFIEVKEIRDIKIRGKKETIKVYNVLGKKVSEG